MKTRATLVVTGALVMAYAAVGALADPDLKPGGVLLFLAAVLIGHDAVWMPAVLAAAVLGRLAPRRFRAAVFLTAIAAVAVTVVAFPLVLGFGRAADNPSVLPLPYGRNLGIVLLAISCVGVLSHAWRTRRGRLGAGRRNSGSPGHRRAGAPDR